jgi:hypothetical protein
MTNIKAISVALGFALLMGATAADEPQILAGQWHCGTTQNSRTGYQCDVIRFSPAFSGTPKVYLSLSKLDLTGSGTIVLESIAARVAQVSWSSFQPEVDATGWTDSTRSKHIEVQKSGNWGGTWIAVGQPQSTPAQSTGH